MNEKEVKMRWVEDNGAWFTPGGEPVYKCSNCGCRKVFGVENGPKLKQCPNCGEKDEDADLQ